jgi:hypothetical protein
MNVYGYKVVKPGLEVTMYGISTMRKLNGEWVAKLTKREKAAIFIKFMFFGTIDGVVNFFLDIADYIDYIVGIDHK